MGKIVELEEILESRKLAWEAYIKFHADDEIPAWIILNETTTESRTTSGGWIVTGYLFKRHPLPSGISWERGKDGSNELVSRDLETGERMLLVSYDVKDSEIVELFSAEVDFSSHIVTMKYAVSVAQLQPVDFMLKYDNFDLTKMWRFDFSKEQNRLNILGHK